MSEAPEETWDSIGTAGVQVVQRRRGYRFTLDAVLLAAFAAGREPDPGPWLELCAGSGVISLLLVRQFGVGAIDALELQAQVHARLVRNVAANGCEATVRPRLGDLRAHPWPPGHYRHVVANPPYRVVGAGMRSPDPERALSKEELACTLADVVAASRHALTPAGRLSLVYPAARLPEALGQLAAQRMTPRALRFVHARAGAPANHVLVRAVRDDAGPLEVQAPWFVHGDVPGSYGPELAALLDPPRSSQVPAAPPLPR